MLCPKSAMEGGKTRFDFFFIEPSANKSWVRSQIFRHGLSDDFFIKGQKGYTLSLTPLLVEWFLVLHFAAKNTFNYDIIISDLLSVCNGEQTLFIHSASRLDFDY